MRLGRTILNIGLIITLCFWIIVDVPAKDLTLDDIFPADRVLDVQITVADKDWDTIRYQSRDFFSALHESRKVAPPEAPYTYVDASVTIDGVLFSNVGLRKKGFLGSLSTTRPLAQNQVESYRQRRRHRGLDQPNAQQQPTGHQFDEPIHGVCVI